MIMVMVIVIVMAMMGVVVVNNDGDNEKFSCVCICQKLYGWGTDHSSTVQDGIYALVKAHMCSIPSHRSLSDAAFGIVPMFV